MAARRAGAGADRQRHAAENEGQRGHHDRAEAQLGRLQRRLHGSQALFLADHHGELDDQDGVLRRQADQGHQADLEVHVVIQPTQPDRQDRAEHREGHRGDHRERQGPALVLGGEDEEHQDQAEDERRTARALGLQFLVGRTDPGQRVVLAERFVGHLLHRRQRLAGAVAGRRAADQLGRREHVEARIGGRAEDALHRHQRRQRHQVAAGRTHVDLAEILRLAAEVRFRLQAHLPGAAVEREVVDVVAAEGGLHGGEHVVDRHAQRARLGAVEVDVVLRHVGVEGTVHPGQFRTLGRGGDELLDDLAQLLAGAAAAVLDVRLEAAGGAHAGDGRRVERQHHAILVGRAHAHEGVGQVARVQFRRGALLPVLQWHERHAGVADGAVGEDVETGEGQHVLHRRMLHQLLGDVAGQFLGAGDRCRRRQEVGVDHVALVLVGHQRAGHAAEQHDHQADHPAEQDQAERGALEEELHARAIAGGGLVEHAVEPAERRQRLLVPGLEDQRAERG
ncbi:hypothetical protein D9M71_242900 [compost metagenome]